MIARIVLCFIVGRDRSRIFDGRGLFWGLLFRCSRRGGIGWIGDFFFLGLFLVPFFGLFWSWYSEEVGVQCTYGIDIDIGLGWIQWMEN